MIIYIINFLSILLYDLILKNKKRVIDLFLIQFWLILCFRSEFLGADVENYRGYYYLWGTVPWREMIETTRFFSSQQITLGLESGYVWFNWLCYNIGLDFHSFLIVQATISMIGLRQFFYRHKIKYPVVIALFFCLSSFMSYFYILRQSLAGIIALQSVESIQKRKLVKFMLWLVLAVSFHRAVIIFIFLYYLYGININKKNLILVTGGGIVTMLSMKYVLSVFYALLNYGGKEGQYDIEMGQGIGGFVFMSLFILFIVWLGKGTKYLNIPTVRVSFYSLFMCLLLQGISYYVPSISRLTYLNFFPLGVIGLNYLLSIQNNKSRYIYIFSLYCVAEVMFWLTLGKNIIPYETFF